MKYSLSAAAVVFASLQGVATADVVINAAAFGEVRFVGVEELSSGSPVGRDGLRFSNNSYGPGWAYGEPAGGFVGNASTTSGVRGDYDGLLPHVGDGWVAGSSIMLDLGVAGHATAASQTVLDLNFENLTGGASVYVLDIEVDWEVRFLADLAQAPTGSALLLAFCYGSTQVGAELTPFEGPGEVRDGAAPKTVLRGAERLHLEIGRTDADPAADSARVQLTLTTVGYVSQVPAPGTLALLGGGVALTGLRRRRRR